MSAEPLKNPLNNYRTAMIFKSLKTISLIGTIVTFFCIDVEATSVIQIPVKSVLNTRPVTTLYKNHITTWTIGIDGNGVSDGYLTEEAALFVGDKDLQALPNSVLIAENNRHPPIQLHYDNKDSKSNQARYLRGKDEFTFNIPPQKYEKLFLFFTSAEGESHLTIEFLYTNSSETFELNVPDYYADIANDDPIFFYVLHDLAKWDRTNKMKEENHHNIDGAELSPNINKILKAVKISKSLKGYLVFWGATGVLTEK